MGHIQRPALHAFEHHSSALWGSGTMTAAVSSSSSSSSSSSPRVFLRLRPPSEHELQRRKRRLLEVVDRCTVAAADDGQELTCQGVFDEGISSDSMYRESIASFLPQHLLDGCHCTIVAYGVTGSGKSQTVQDLTKPLLGGIFAALERRQVAVENALRECSIRCSVVEVYLERLRDLLHEPSTVQLDHHGTDAAGQFSGCAALACLCAEDALNVIDRARTVRTASAVVPNDASNRSTAVIQLTIRQTLRDGTIVESRLHIIDLLACELVVQQPASNDNNSTPSLEAIQVSMSLKALHKQIRHFATGKAPIPMADLPILAQLLSYSFSSTNLSVFLTASPCAVGSESLFKFGADCQRVRTTVERHVRPVRIRTPWRRLARALAGECRRGGVVVDNDGKVKALMQRIIDNDVASFDDEPTGNNNIGGQDHDRIRLECERAKSERDQLCSDLAILQAQSLALTSQNQKMKQEMDRLQQELRSSQFQRHQVEETLRISQFREAEAVVFLRQVRRFYFRLLQKTASEGSSDNLTMQLVDMDHFMMKSGLLEVTEVGGDVAAECRPSRQSLERSMAEREQAEKQAQRPPENQPNTEGTGPITLMDDQPPLPVSINEREDPGKVEARQRLYKTPAGRYIAMRERILEEEVMQLSEMNSQLQHKLREVMANYKELSAKGGITASLDKLRVGQEIRALNEQLGRKNNDLKAVIWKMNELHMVGKTLQSQAQGKDGHISHLEQSLLDLRAKHAAAIEDRKGVESSLQLKVNHLKGQMQSLLIPVWQLSPDRKALATIPLQGRMTIPFGNVPLDQRDNESLGEAGEWVDLGLFPGNFSGEDKNTQTDDAPVNCVSTQTMESVYVVDRTNTRSIDVQTDDVITDTLNIHKITESNIESLMFMMSPPTSDVKPKVDSTLLKSNLRGSDVFETSVVESSPQMFSNSPIGSYARYGLQAEKAIDRQGADPYEYTPSIANDAFDADETDFSSKMFYESYIARTFKISEPMPFQTSEALDFDSTFPSNPKGTDDEIAVESAHAPGSFRGKWKASSRSDMGGDLPENGEEKVLDTLEGFQPSGIVGSSRVGSVTIETSDHHRKLNVHDSDITKVDTHEDLETSSTRKSVDNGINLGGIVRSPDLQEQTHSEFPTIEQGQMLHQSDEKTDAVERVLRATKSEGSPKKAGKTPKTDRNLTSFLDRLQNQAKKRLEDDDEKTTTPEFMKLFKKIGGKNKNETVVETSGAVAPRDAQRTSFAQLKLGQKKVVDPRQMEAPSKSWQPKKKQAKDDSDSSEDDSFHRNFTRGAQKGAPARNSDHVTSQRHSGSMAPECSDSDSDDDGFARSFTRGAQVPSNSQCQKTGRRTSSSSDGGEAVLAGATTEQGQVLPSETNSSSSDSDSAKPTRTSQVEAQAEATKIAPAGNTSDDSSSHESSPLRVVTRDSRSSSSSVAPHEAKATIAAPVAKRVDSDSSSSSSDKSTPFQRPFVIAPTAAPRKALDDSSDESSDDGGLPHRPSAAVINPKSLRKAESSSSSSDSSSKQNQAADKSKSTTAYVQVAKLPIKSTQSPTKPSSSFKRGSDDDSSSSAESSTKKSKVHVSPVIVQAPQQKPPVKCNESDGSSDDSESVRDNQRRNGAAQNAVVPNHSAVGKSATLSKDSSEDDSSDSDSSSGREKAKAPIVKAGAPRKTTSSDEESSSDDARKSKNDGGSKNNMKNQHNVSDESSSSNEENNKTAKNVPQSVSSSDSEDEKRPAVSGKKASSSSSDDDSNSSSDRAKTKHKAPVDPKVDQKANAPKSEVPDFAARLKQAAAAAANGKKKKKRVIASKSSFIIRDGMVVRRSDVGPDETGGKATKKETPPVPAKSPATSADASPPRRRIRSRSAVGDKKFELKDGKLVRKTDDGKGAKKASFKIVNGKLVKADDDEKSSSSSSSSDDSDGTEKIGKK